MNERRDFIKYCMALFAGMSMWSGSLFSAVRRVYAGVHRTILPKGTDREDLIRRDPKSLDTRNLELTPLRDFDTMGMTNHRVNLKEWRFEVHGRVNKQLRLTYQEILGLPAIEKNVLLICPGFFANHGQWKGISMKALLEKAGVKKDARRVTFSGPQGGNEQEKTFPIEEVLTDKVFLAYEVNGEPLPERNGFPLRVVAEDYYGGDWIKYVYKMTLEKM